MGAAGRAVDLSEGAVRLSPLDLADVAPHLAGEDTELVRWLSGGTGTRRSVENYIRRCMAQWESGGPVHAFGIRVGPELAGTLEVQFDQPYLEAGEVNLSYGLYPEWRGRGLATRAVNLAGRYAAGQGAVRAVIRTEAGNRPSAAVALRAGYVRLHRSGAVGGEQYCWFVKDLASLEIENTDAPAETKPVPDAKGRWTAD